MTDPTEPGTPADAPLDPIDPRVEAAVRRTLAAAGGPEPIPDEVAARLDGVLDGLVAERAATVSHPENPGIVVPLDAAARRRRVRVRMLLGAAAAVVAVAVGAGVVNDTPGDGGADASTAADEAPARDEDSAAAGDDGAVGEELAEGGSTLEGESASPSSPSSAPEPGAAELRRVVTDERLRDVRADRLREDLVALQHVSLPHPATADYSRATLTAPADFMCEPAEFGPGYLVGVRYDGRPAVVAFREPMGSNQAAEVLACGTGDVLHSTILPAS